MELPGNGEAAVVVGGYDVAPVPQRCARAAAGVEARRVAYAFGGGVIGVRVIVLRVRGGFAWDQQLAIVDLFVVWGAP